jgi:hypothetical protein
MPFKDYNKKKLYSKEQRKKWKNSHREQYRNYQRAHRMSCFERFLSYNLSKIRSSKKHECSLDLEYLMGLLNIQNSRCKITNVLMDHCHNSIRSVSIDRINSEIGYVRGNIQLVCSFINLGKNKFSNNEVISLINDFRFLEEFNDGSGI